MRERCLSIPTTKLTSLHLLVASNKVDSGKIWVRVYVVDALPWYMLYVVHCTCNIQPRL